MLFPQFLFLSLSFIVTLLFFLYGFNHYYLLFAARSYRVRPLPGSNGERPRVSIHLPIYNEKYVVRRLVVACTRLAETYGIDRVNILILDDSDDDTASKVDEVAHEYLKKHFNIEVVRRASRQGFKAGALQAALERTSEEFIAIFDADFIPPPDFLVRSLPYFVENERLGVLQGRWTHLNRDYNLLTRAIAIGIDIHFIIEQPGRYAAGLLQNFNGTGGVLRKRAVLEAGGWQPDTLAEDLDLSYRLQLQGYRVIYLKDLLCPGEIPPTISGFKSQQGRWACGSLRTARKILPAILANNELKFRQRLQAFIHLTGYIIHPLMTLSFILTCMATFFGWNGIGAFLAYSQGDGIPDFGGTALFWNDLPWMLLGLMILLCTMAPWVASVSTLRSLGLSLARNMSSLLLLFLLGFGISLNSTWQAGKAILSNRRWEFVRTPKYAELHRKTGWRSREYQIAPGTMWLAELAFGCMGLMAIGVAIWRSSFFVLLILMPFTTAYVFVSLLTVVQSRGKKGM
ncbi:MAG: glycosyltransferase [Chloroflexi bacterium]|nr:glycosyltransferase [Chloroflexota bacterium]